MPVAAPASASPAAEAPAPVVEADAKVVQAIETQAVTADRKRLADLSAAFPENATFVNECFAAGLSVEQAKAKRYDAAQAEIAQLKQQVAASNQPTIGFAASDKPAAGTVSQTADQTEAEAARIWNSSPQIREEFGGQFSTFRADFKNHPGDYTSKK